MANDPYVKRLLWFVFAGSRGGINRLKLVLAIKERPLNANHLQRWASITNMIILGILMVMFGRMYVKARAQLLGTIMSSVFSFCTTREVRMHTFQCRSFSRVRSFPYLLGVHIAELAEILIFLKITMD